MTRVIDSAPYEHPSYTVYLLDDGTVEKRILRAQGFAPDLVVTFASEADYHQARILRQRGEIDRMHGYTGGQRIHGRDVICVGCGWSPSEAGYHRTPSWCSQCKGFEWTRCSK